MMLVSERAVAAMTRLDAQTAVEQVQVESVYPSTDENWRIDRVLISDIFRQWQIVSNSVIPIVGILVPEINAYSISSMNTATAMHKNSLPIFVRWD